MKILIIEGIATSGKSSLIKEIVKLAPEASIKVYSESDTHTPIMDDKGKLHVDFFRKLVKNAEESKKDTIIFDRFHFTQAIRANAEINSYESMEDMLLKHDTCVLCLKIEESKIKNRVEHSSKRPRVGLANEHSSKNWGEYIKTKGNSYDEIADYYKTQQRKLLMLLQHSKIKSSVLNATENRYPLLAKEVYELYISPNKLN